VTGTAHPILGGTGWERTPWHATQRAALEAVEERGEQTMMLRERPVFGR
jgi:hypothetical protein